MPLVALSLSSLRADFVEAPGNAQRAWAHREGVLIRATLDGLTGVGEASPLPPLSRESVDDVRRSIDALGALRVPLARAPLSTTLASIRLPPSARFGLETALFDLAAQVAGVPLATWLGAESRVVRVQALVDRLGEPVPMAGTHAVKVKIGRAGREVEECALLRSLRAASPSLLIRADANGAPVGAALSAALVEVGCALLEDPAAPVPGLPTALDAPFADDPEVAIARIARGEAQAAVLKPTLVGGIARTLAIVGALAALAPSALVIVSHALESPVALSAALHLALATGVSGPHGLGPWQGLDRFESAGEKVTVPDWIVPGQIRLSERAGLGWP